MKKITFVFAACVIASSLFAQKMMVQSAFTYKGRGQFDKARECIDKAVVHPDTKDDVKAWTYRGEIYYNIQISKDPKIKACVQNPLDSALASYGRAMKLDTKYEFGADIRAGFIKCAAEAYTRGIDKFNEKEYVKAFELFESANAVGGLYDSRDSLFYMTNYNAAISAENTKSPEYIAKAKKCYFRLVKMKYRNATVYTSLANIIKADKDTVKALKIIQEGRAQMPENLELIIAEANIYLQQHKSKEAQELLKLAIEKDPKNPLLHIAVGQKYDETDNLIDAEKEYLIAMELIKDQKDPNYFIVVYNLGALYFNEFRKIKLEAEKLPDGDSKYDLMQKSAEEYFAKALPMLEKAELLSPDDKSTLLSLKQMYSIKNNKEGLDRVKAKLDKKK